MDLQSRPWLKHYGDALPAQLTYPDKSLQEILHETVENFPERAALIFLGRTIRYSEFYQAVCRFANMLERLGVKPGDRVCLYLPNTPHMVIGYYGCLLAGAVAVPTNPLYTVRELRHQVVDSGSQVVVTLNLKLTLDTVVPLVEEGHLRHVVVGSVRDYLPNPIRLLYSFAKRKELSPIPDSPIYSRYAEHLQNASPVRKLGDTPDLDSVAVLIYTGATTGVSKGVMLSHRNLMVNAVQGAVWGQWREGRCTDPETTVVILPLFHSFSMTVAMNRLLYRGGTMLLFPQRPRKDMLDLLKVIKKYKPHVLPGVPTLYTAMVNQPRCNEFGVDSIKVCNSGAAPLPVEVIKQFEKMTGAVIVEGYGLSEASPVTHCNPAEGLRKPGSIGIPVPDTDARIVDETGTPVPPGKEGELLIQGPQVMGAYWNRPEETEEALRDGWLYTGDMAKMDEDGFFYIVDRKKDLIITSGYNIYPREIEEVLYEHPAVLEAAAVGVPDKDRGERVKAVVVLKAGASASSEDLIAFCREHLAAYKVPKYLEFKDELPKSNVGKVLRRMLREEPKPASEPQQSDPQAQSDTSPPMS